MGSGVGSLVRLAIRLYAYFILLESRGYTVMWALKLYKRLRFKYPFLFKIVV